MATLRHDLGVSRFKLRRLRGKWWIAKHKHPRMDVRWHWSRWLEQEFGLIELKWDPSRLPNAKA
jgi:hypothetical protein